MSTSTPNGQRVLIVDDNPSIVTVLRHALLAEGCLVDVAGDGLEALRRVADCPPDLILLDLDLPRLTGDAICRRLKNDPATSLIPIVMITGQGDFENKLAAWEYGADDFLPKPFHVVEVTLRCRSLLRIRRLIGERDSAEAVVFALARTVEAKSPYTHGHSERVLRYALSLADALKVSSRDRKVLEKGALLHDIGKISVPDAILDKPDKLTREEFEIVKGHAVQGARIVEGLLSLKDAVPLIRWHHERLDGQGYPDGLRGEQIPQIVRILSIADIYDSLASDRPYRPSIPHARCLEMLRDNALGGGLDPELVAVFGSIVTPLPTPSISPTACPPARAEAARPSDVLPSPSAFTPKR
jgi:putative two-component system response regulator